MLVSVYCTDTRDSAAPRREKLQAHLRYVETIQDKIKVAGPVTDPEAGRQVASLLVFEVQDLAEADALMRADPYYDAGIWETINLHEFRGVVGDWVGGKQW